MILRKFYNVDAAEAPAATEVQEPLSMAAQMAQHGQKSTNDYAAPPIVLNTERKEQTTETPSTESTAIVTPEVKVEEVKTETPPSTEVKVETLTPQIEETRTPQPSWQEVAQKQPNEVFKALGVDDKVVSLIGDLKEIDPKMVGILEAYKKGELVQYVKELSTDYSKLSAEEVMRHQLRADYPTANEKTIDVLYKREVVAAYSLDSDDPDELEEGKLLLEAKADRYREALIQKQKDFLIQPYTAKAAVEPDNKAQEQAAEADRQFNEKYKSEVSSNPLVKNIIANKSFTIGEGEGRFTHPVEPNDIFDVLYNNNNKWSESMWEKQIDANGQPTMKPKTEHQILVATVAKYGMPFINKIAEHYTSLGAKTVITPLENASQPNGVQQSASSQAEPTTNAGGLAKYGVRNSGSR